MSEKQKPIYRGRGRAMRINRDDESSVSSHQGGGRQQSDSGSGASYSTYMPSTAPSEASLATLAPRQQQSSSSGSSGGRGRSSGRVYRRTGGRGSGGSRDRNLEEGRIPLSSGTSSSSGGKSGKSTGSSGQEGKADEEIKADRAEIRLKMGELAVSEKQLMPRPGYGTVGQRSDVTTNSWEVKFKRDSGIKIYQYILGNDQFENDFDGGSDRRPNVQEAFKFFRDFEREFQKIYPGARIWYDGKKAFWSDKKHLDGQGNVTFICDMLKRGRSHDGSVTVPYKFSKQFSDVQLQDLIRFMQNPDDSLVRPDYELILCIDYLLKTKLSISHPRISSSFFPNQGGQGFPLGNGKVAMPGFMANIKANQNKMHVQVKHKLGAFHQDGPAIAYLNACFYGNQQQGGGNRGGRRGGYQGQGAGDAGGDITRFRGFFQDERNIRKATGFLKGLQINIRYNGNGGSQNMQPKTRKVKSLSPKPANVQLFDVHDREHPEREPTRLIVADYFMRTHGIRLQYPELPCVNVKSLKNPEYYPLEMCFILPMQPIKEKLKDQEVASMIRHCAKPAPDTMRACAEDFRSIKEDFRKDLDLLGMDVADQPSKVPCRILPGPRLRYKSRIAEIRDGQWRPDEFRFIKKPLEVYEVYVFGDPNLPRDAQPTCVGFINNLVRQAHKVGFPMADKPWNFDGIRVNNEQSISRFLEERFRTHESERRMNSNHKLQLIICCMPRKDSKLYSTIKFYAERVFGIMTQCITWKSVMSNSQRSNDQLGTMLLMKINAKLGGINCTIDFDLPNNTLGLFSGQNEKPQVLVCGLSINNPQRNINTGSRPSIAALAGSIDKNAAQYTFVADISTDTIVATNLKDMMTKTLKKFYVMNNQAKPSAIIMFRSGVSDAEKEKVAGFELDLIEKACKGLEENYQPKLTYITCDKTHGTRFASKDRNMQIGKSQNCPSGMIVDRDVVSNHRFDFYLQSSQGIQGTSIPTYYVVCRDDTMMHADTVQVLTFYLCHGFTRCNRTIGEVTPLRYAALAAERGRIWITKSLYDSDFSSDSDSVMSAGSRGSDNVAPEIIAKARSILDFDECCKTLQWTDTPRQNSNHWMSNPLNNKFFYT